MKRRKGDAGRDGEREIRGRKKKEVGCCDGYGIASFER